MQPQQPSAQNAATWNQAFMMPSAPVVAVHEAGNGQSPSGAAPAWTIAEITAITPPPSAAEAPAPAPAPRAAPMGNANVLVPTGAAPGQRIQFTPPGGSPMYVTTSEVVAPNSILTVQYPLPAPAPAPRAPQPAQFAQHRSAVPAAALPMPGLTPEEDARDVRESQMQWFFYGASWLSCCLVGPLLALVMWTALALVYYCRPQHARERRPRQRAPARAAAITAASVCACLAFLGITFLSFAIVCGVSGDQCSLPSWWNPDNYHFHTPTAPFGGKVNLTLSGFHCDNNYGSDNNQRYLYQGTTKDGRAYYRGEKDTERYIYYDARCDDKDVTVGAWILGRKPDIYADHGLDKAPRAGCWNDAFIKSRDFSLPVDSQLWDWVWCGKYGTAGNVLTVDVDLDSQSDVATLPFRLPPFFREHPRNYSEAMATTTPIRFPVIF